MSVKKSSEKKPRNSRSRNFATIVYPSKIYLDGISSTYDGADGYGSSPENWQEIIADLHIPAMISPLHQDYNPDRTMKKPHFHVFFMFDTVKDWDTQVKEIFDSFGGIGRENINSARGYARYLCHLDNPEKEQYSPDDVKCFGGADYRAVVHLPTDDMKILVDVFAYIKANQIFSLAELLDICSMNNPDWFSTITMSRGYIVDKYIKSLAWEQQSGYVRKSEEPIDSCNVNPATGEVIEEDKQS